MAPFPIKMNSGLANPRWRTSIEWLKKICYKSDRKLDELTEEMRETKQRLAGLEQKAQQPRLTMEADVQSDIKTLKRMEDVAVERVIDGDNSSAQVHTDPMCLTSFGADSTGPPVLPCTRDDALVDNGAAAPSRVAQPRRCARKQPPVACSPPAQPLQRLRPASFPGRFFLGASERPRNVPTG